MAFIGSRAATSRLSDTFARALTPTRPAGPSVGALVGLEHEFRVRLDGRPIDFRQVIHRLPIDGLRIDPADPDAYRCLWGGTITADGPEAEIAIAPVAAGPAMAGRVVGTGARARAELEAVLPPGATLEGYSTHLSVGVPDRLLDRTADRFIRHFSVAMTLLLDGPASPGLLVRPRLGRLEIGGEFADDDRLAAATIFALGATRAAARRSPVAGRRLPPALAVAPQPAIERYGWFVGDTELAAPLHRDGVGTLLRLADGRSMSAGAHLARAWSVARRELGDLGAATLAMVDAAIEAVIAGRPVAVGPGATGSDVVGFEPAATRDAAPDAWALATRRRTRPGFAVDPVVLSWDFAVFRLTGGRREAYACLPRHVLGDALAALDGGRLDHLLRAYLFADAGDGRILASSGQTTAAGLYRGIGKAADLAGVERDPVGGAGKRRRRDDQDQRPDDSVSRSQQARSVTKTSTKVGAGAGAAAGLTILGLPAAAAAAIGGVAIVAVVGGVVVLGGGGAGGGGTPTAPATATAPSASVAVASATPSASPGAVDFGTGSATFRITSGGSTIENSAPMRLGTVEPRGSIDFVWDDVDPTDPGLFATRWLQLTFIPDPSGTTTTSAGSPGVSVGVSQDGTQTDLFFTNEGECTVITNLTATELSGSFICSGTFATSPTLAGQAFDSSGEFSASVSGSAPPPPAPSPPASLASPAGAITNAICDPWLDATTVTSIVGLAPIEIRGNNFLNDGQPVDCTFLFNSAGDEKFDFVALQQDQYGGVDDFIDENGNIQEGLGDPVPELGTGAYTEAGPRGEIWVYWFPDDRLQLYVLSYDPASIGLADLIELAQSVTVQSFIPGGA